MIEIAIVGLFAVAVLAWVLTPILLGAVRKQPSTPSPPAAVRKNTALAAIVDLEEERALGKLATPDFEALKANYEAEALAALRELTAASVTSAPSDEALEAEIAELRAALACPRCGRALSGTGTCSQCGA